VPAPGQGAIAIVCRKDNSQLIKILRSIQDSYSKAEIDAERALLRKIEGGCRFPVGAVATTAPNKQKIILYASIFSADGTKSIKLRETGSLNDPDRLGAKTGRLLLEEGASKLSAGWREEVAKWNKKL
jgi:hydroxymethylbilane synthase